MITKFKIYEQWVTDTTNGEEPIYNREKEETPESDLVKKVKNFINSNKIINVTDDNGALTVVFKSLEIEILNNYLRIDGRGFGIPNKDFHIIYDYVLSLYHEYELKINSDILDKIDPLKIGMEKFNI